MWKSLPAHSAWPTPCMEREAGHRLVRDLRVDADHVRPLQRRDEVQRVADRRQEHVAARLVRLRLQREAHAVALRRRRSRTARRSPRGSGRARRAGPSRRPSRCLRGRPRTRTPRRPAPRPRSIARIALPIAARRTRRSFDGERAVLEHRLPEQVRRRHADAQAGLLQRGLEAGDDAVALGRGGAVGTRSSSCRLDAPGAELGEPADRVDRVERLAGRARRTGRGRGFRRSRARR